VKRRHRPRPFDTLIVMVCLYYRAHKPWNANTITAHLYWD
jgi:hypothetical protein